jgi:hypothetical protein
MPQMRPRWNRGGEGKQTALDEKPGTGYSGVLGHGDEDGSSQTHAIANAKREMLCIVTSEWYPISFLVEAA